MNKLWILILLFGVSACIGFADTFSFSGNSLTSIQAEGREKTVLTGNARITSGATTITADIIEIFGSESRYAFCTGSVQVIDDERGILLTSETLFYDRDRELSRVEGYAEMQDQRNEIVVKGHYLEHSGDTEVTIIQIGVRILKATDGEEMAARAEFVRYLRNNDVLELSGMPKVVWKGDEYSASRITIDLEKDEILLDGKVSGTISDEEGSETPSAGESDTEGSSSDEEQAADGETASPDDTENVETGEETSQDTPGGSGFESKEPDGAPDDG